MRIALFIVSMCLLIFADAKDLKDVIVGSEETSLLSTLFSYILRLAGLAWNTFYVFGTIPQYYPQIREIRQGQGESFSPWICWILLTSNIIRIFYWFAEPFDTVLLGQSIVMVCVQLALLHAIAYSRQQKVLKSGKPFSLQTIWDTKLHNFSTTFWNWDDFNSYVVYSVTLGSSLALLCALFLPSKFIGNMLGNTGLAIEACLGLPQLYKNYKNGTGDLSPLLFWTWLIGDIAKTVFYVILSAPLPFLGCGLFQIITDIAILAQIYIARKQQKQE